MFAHRRVEGGLPSPRSKECDGDHLNLPSGLLRRSDPVAYLVRSFQTNARIRSLTTGTFNRVVKDRIAFRLSGANSVQANSHKCESDCPRNLTNIRRCARPCQRKRPTEFPRDFHNGNSERLRPEEPAKPEADSSPGFQPDSE